MHASGFPKRPWQMNLVDMYWPHTSSALERSASNPLEEQDLQATISPLSDSECHGVDLFI